MKLKEKMLVLRKREAVNYNFPVNINDDSLYLEDKNDVPKLQNFSEEIVVFDRMRFN